MDRRWRVLGVMVLTCAMATSAASPARAAVTAPTPAQLRPELVAGAEQLVVVSTRTWVATTGSASLYERTEAAWKRVAGPFVVRLGRHGTKVGHVEGDGTTPAGSWQLVSAFGLSATAGTKLAYHRVHAGDCWISDLTRADYNTRTTKVPCGAANEDLWRLARSGVYRRVVVTSYNTDPVVPGAGSAIFLHRHAYTAAGATKPTSGCISFSEHALGVLWRRLDPAAHPRVVVGPASWLRAG